MMRGNSVAIYNFIVVTKVDENYRNNVATKKIMSQHNEELKVEKLCRDIEIICHNTIKSSKKETLS